MKYGLMLNDMRSSNIENLHCVKVSRSRQELVDFYNSELAEKPWTDGQWHKIFKQGSILEWCNSADLEEDNDYWGGVYTFREEAPDEAILEFSLSK